MNTSATKVIDNAIVGFVLKYLKRSQKRKKDNHERIQSGREYSPQMDSEESHSAQIFRAARALDQNGLLTFTRDDIRRYLNLSHKEWLNGYTAIFQGMRIDPGSAPKVGKIYQGVFRRIRRGIYKLIRNE